MKKFIKITALFLVMLIFASCSNQTAKEQTSSPADSTCYSNVAFDELKTFTEITGVALNSTDEDEIYTTTFSYISFENIAVQITAYKTTLLESGFKLTSELDDEVLAFELSGQEISISTESSNSGTTVNITIPCDEETVKARQEIKYNEMLKSFEEKEYRKAYSIAEMFSAEENYKDITAYRLFSEGMLAYENNFFGKAAEEFKAYIEKYPDDKLGAQAYIQKCNDTMSKYNGTYSGKGYRNGLKYFMLIKDGEVAFEFDYRSLGISGYNIGDPVYYMYDLQINDYGDGIVGMKTASSFSLNDVEYKHDLVLLDNGDILVNKFGHDVINYQSDTSTFAGEYTKVAEAPDKK